MMSFNTCQQWNINLKHVYDITYFETEINDYVIMVLPHGMAHHTHEVLKGGPMLWQNLMAIKNFKTFWNFKKSFCERIMF